MVPGALLGIERYIMLSNQQDFLSWGCSKSRYALHDSIVY